jgi:hypothetical protein
VTCHRTRGYPVLAGMNTDEGAFLRELDHTVRAELTEAEPDGAATDEWPPDPDAQRLEAGLVNLLGAVEAVEDEA